MNAVLNPVEPEIAKSPALSEEISAGLADLERQVNESEAEQPAPAFTSIEEVRKKGEAWMPVTTWCADLLKELADNWKISPAAYKLLTQGSAEILDTWMPGGIENMENWGPWIKLLAGIGMLGAANFDYKQWKASHYKTYQFKPMQVSDEKIASGTADGGGRPDAERKDPQHAA